MAELLIKIPEETLEYYVKLEHKGEQLNDLEKIILDGIPAEDLMTRRDVIAMLSDLKSKIEKQSYKSNEFAYPVQAVGVSVVDDNIQEKINVLKVE